MKDIAIEQMNEEQQNDDYALSLNNQLRAVEEDRDRLKEENDKLKKELNPKVRTTEEKISNFNNRRRELDDGKKRIKDKGLLIDCNLIAITNRLQMTFNNIIFQDNVMYWDDEEKILNCIVALELLQKQNEQV